VDIGAGDIDGGHLAGGDDEAFGLEIGVEFALHGQACFGRGGTDKVWMLQHQAHKCTSAPARNDERLDAQSRLFSGAR